MMSFDKKKKTQCLAVTMGEPAGIGPEIILKSYLQRKVSELPIFAVYGCPKTLQARAQLFGIECSIREIETIDEAFSIFRKEIPVFPLPVIKETKPGVPDPDNSQGTIDAITKATHSVLKGDAAALVTNPISKAVLYKSGFSFPGHTEYIAHLAEKNMKGGKIQPIMMLLSQTLRVVPVTIHIPISEIPNQLSQPLLEHTIRGTWRSLKEDFKISDPRISVTGLNPHAGESGSIGCEEIDIIKPVLEALSASGMKVSGPYSADTLFHAGARTSFDAAICMYHDQALIPLKTLDFETGVNLTLGLPIVRTSPDHGTAFNIANKGIASPKSLLSAIQIAAEISDRRHTLQSL